MKCIVISVFLLSTLYLSAQHDWTRTNPGGGGAIAMVGADVDGNILVASDLSGIYKSYDDGVSWRTIGASQGLLETHISSFGFDPNDANNFIAGTYLGAYKTSDGGNSFTQVFPGTNNSFEYSYVEDIVISKSDSDIGYITHHPSTDSYGDVYRTTDGGDTWNAVIGENLPDNLRLVKLLVHPMDANIVYVLTGKTRWGCSPAKLYRSIDGGINWTEIGVGLGEMLDVDVHPTQINTVFLSTFESVYQNDTQCKDLSVSDYLSDDELAGSFYKSTNGGASFSQLSDKTGIISVGLTDPNVIRLLNVIYPYDWNDEAGTWQTINGGLTWTHTGLRVNWSQGYSENQYYAYSLSFNGLNKTVTKDIFNSDRYYASFGQWAWGSFDGGATLNNISTNEVSLNHWKSTGVENMNGHCLEINDNNPNVVYIGGWDIGFWYSRDHGASWSRTQPNYNIYPEYSWDLGTPPVSTNMAKRGAGANVLTVVNDPERENVVWASFSKEQYTDLTENVIAKTGLFKSVNYGEDWTLVSNGLPTFSSSYKMYGLSIDLSSPINNRTMFLTVDGNLYKSTNDGVSWSSVLTNGGLKFTKVNKNNGSIVYAGGENGFWRSVDEGNTWTESGTSQMRPISPSTRTDIVPTWVDYSGAVPLLPYEGVFDIQVDPNIDNRVYVTVIGPAGGLFRSDDSGLTWSSPLLSDVYMRGVAIAPFNSNVIYATSSLSYHSGGYGNSNGIYFSADAGQTWSTGNDNMAYHYAGIIEVESGNEPNVWVWSPGTGVQHSPVPIGNLVVDLKTSLQGPFNSTNLMMNDDLRVGNHIPLMEPFSQLGFEHVGGGGESINQNRLLQTGNDAIVDWIFVELRNGNSPSEIIATKSALLQRDGDIVDLDGISSLVFSYSSNTNVFVALRHRNHLGVRTHNNYTTANSISIDFTNETVPLYGAIQGFDYQPMVLLSGKRNMIAGDANRDGNINVVDKNTYWRPQNGVVYDYLDFGADFDLNGAVNSIDLNTYWRPNNSKVQFLD